MEPINDEPINDEPINDDQLPTFPSYYGGDSPPFFGRCVGDWLQGIFSISIFRDFLPLLGRPVQVFSSCGNVPLGEFILVELDLGFCTSSFTFGWSTGSFSPLDVLSLVESCGSGAFPDGSGTP